MSPPSPEQPAHSPKLDQSATASSPASQTALRLAEDTLRDFGWKRHDGEPINAFYRRFWGQTVPTETVEAHDDWQSAIVEDPRLLESATRFGLVKPDHAVDTRLLEVLDDDEDYSDAPSSASVVTNTQATGCLPQTHYLDLGNNAFMALQSTNNRIVVRKDYVYLYSLIKEVGYNVVLTGQADCGKTYCLYYIMAQRMQQGLPVLLCPGDDVWIFFSSLGVWTIEELRVDDTNRHTYDRIFPRNTWALIDGDKFMHTRGRSYLNFLTIFTSSPDTGRYESESWLDTSSPPLLRVLGPPTYMEIFNCARLQVFQGSSRQPADTTAESFGNLLHAMFYFGRSLSTCSRALAYPVEDSKFYVMSKINIIQLPTLERLFDSIDRTIQTTPSSVTLGRPLLSLSASLGAEYVYLVKACTIMHRRCGHARDNHRLSLEIASAPIFRLLFDEFMAKNMTYNAAVLNDLRAGTLITAGN